MGARGPGGCCLLPFLAAPSYLASQLCSGRPSRPSEALSTHPGVLGAWCSVSLFLTLAQSVPPSMCATLTMDLGGGQGI